MSRLGAAVNIITTDGPAGRHGFTATAVCSVTDTPPTIAACLNRGSGSYATFLKNGTLGINVLAKHHELLSARFARSTDGKIDRFEVGAWKTLITGAPILEDALVGIDCKIRSKADVGTHVVLFAEVFALSVNQDAQALMYYDRGYHTLERVIDPHDIRVLLPAPEDIMF